MLSHPKGNTAVYWMIGPVVVLLQQRLHRSTTVLSPDPPWGATSRPFGKKTFCLPDLPKVDSMMPSSEPSAVVTCTKEPRTIAKPHQPWKKCSGSICVQGLNFIPVYKAKREQSELDLENVNLICFKNIKHLQLWKARR
eukprot:1157493-Pelagomonas_calceolata.AAC.8